MASNTLGRVVCPIGCGHQAAQVKLKTDKTDGKVAYPYIHCAGCGIQLHTRSKEQAAHLLKSTRLETALAGAPVPLPDVPESTKMPMPAPKPGGFFDGIFGSAP